MERKLSVGTRILITTSLMFGSVGCARLVSNEEIQVDATSTRNALVTEPSIPFPSRTPTRILRSTRTATRTPRRTPLPTFTPPLTPSLTPDWGDINSNLIETALDKETIILRQFAFDQMIVLHPYGIKDLIYGVETDEKGQTTVLFENMDCQFMEIRDSGALGEKEDIGTLILPADSWGTYKVVFDEVRVKKTSELPGDIEVFESESFVLNGEEVICPKVPVVQPATDFAKRIYNQAREIVIELVNRYSEKSVIPTP